jgi:hypothetical protein
MSQAANPVPSLPPQAERDECFAWNRSDECRKGDDGPQGQLNATAFLAGNPPQLPR